MEQDVRPGGPCRADVGVDPSGDTVGASTSVKYDRTTGGEEIEVEQGSLERVRDSP